MFGKSNHQQDVLFTGFFGYDKEGQRHVCLLVLLLTLSILESIRASVKHLAIDVWP